MHLLIKYKLKSINKLFITAMQIIRNKNKRLLSILLII